MNDLNVVSRRGFLTGSMAFAAGLALDCMGGDFFYATPAWANSSTPETKIILVGSTQLGVVVYDMTDPNKPTVVPNAQVTITSRFNSKSVTGTSDAEGKIVLEIKDLAEDDPDNSNEYPSFNGSINVQKDGYREVNIPLARICGHSAFIAPTRPLDNKPYFRSLTFNDWDVQYSKPQFTKSDVNTEIHTIKGELWMPDASQNPTANLIFAKDGKEKQIESFKILKKEGNVTTVEISQEFLNSTKDTCINDSITPKVIFGQDGSQQQFETTVNITAKEAPIKEPKKLSKVVVPSANDHSVKLFKLPDKYIPPLRNMNFSVWQPTCPFIFQISPAGFLIMGYGYSDLVGKDDTGHILPETEWKKYPTKSFMQQMQDKWKNTLKKHEKYKKQSTIPNTDKTKLLSHRLTTNFTAGVKLQAFGMMKIDYETMAWTGALSAVFVAQASATWTWQCTFLYVPVFFQISPSCSFNVSLYLGATGNNPETPENFTFTPSRTFGFGINISIAVTAGIGIEGFVSFSCTGSAYVSAFLNYLPNPDAESPRVIAGYGVSVYLTIQLFLIKFSFTAWELDEPQAFDSSKETSRLSSANNENESPEALNSRLSNELKGKLGLSANDSSIEVGSGEMPSFEELEKNAVIVTAAEMLNSQEFEMTKDFSGVSPVIISFDSPETLPNSTDVFNVDSPFADIIIEPNQELANAADDNYLPTYTYTGQAANSDSISNADIDVEGLSTHVLGGINPSFDNLMFKDVTSNPKMKAIHRTEWSGFFRSHFKPYVFRLATVKIDDQHVRTRIVYHCFNEKVWSAPHVIEFDPGFDGIQRNDLYDVDFDVCRLSSSHGRLNNRKYVFLIVTHTTRPDGDNTEFYNGIQAKFASLVALYETGDENCPLKVDPEMTSKLCHAEDDGTLISPAIVAWSGEEDYSDDLEACVFASLSYSKIDRKQGLSETTTRCVWFGRYEVQDDGSIKFKITPSQKPINGFQSVLSGIQRMEYTQKHNGCSRVRTTCSFSCDDGKLRVVKHNAQYVDGLASSRTFFGFGSEDPITFDMDGKNIEKIYYYGKLSDTQYRLLATVKQKNSDGENTSVLYSIDVNSTYYDGTRFTSNQIGEMSGCASDLTHDAKFTYMFYSENIDGKTGQEYDVDEETGEPKVKGDIKQNRYYIKAIARIGDGSSVLFTRPFIFAELEHAADSLVASHVTPSYIGFLVNDITDMSKSISNIYDVRVPFVTCITPTALECADPFCFPGDSATFSVTLRNDGNVVAQSCTAYLVDASTGERVDSKELTFTKSQQTNTEELDDSATKYDTSSWENNSELFNNPLVANEGNDVLVPGDTGTYNVDLKIPDAWSKEKIVRVEIDDIKYIYPSAWFGSNNENSDSDVQTYSIPESDLPTDTITLASSINVDANGTSGEVIERGKDDSDKDNGSRVDDHSKNNTPDTGDHSKGDIVTAALGAAAAGFAAYSLRRSMIEQEENRKEVEAKE